VLCLGLATVPAAPLLARLGSRSAIVVALGMVGIGGVLRALAPSSTLVIALTLVVGIGMGLAGALLPGFIRERSEAMPARATASYVAGIQLGGVSAAGLAVPVAQFGGSWRVPLLGTSLTVVAFIVLWTLLTRASPTTSQHATASSSSARRIVPRGAPSKLLVLLVALFALRSVVFQGLNAWLPAIYVEQGWSGVSAGGLAAVLAGMGIPATLVVGWGGDRYGTRRHWLATAGFAMTIGIAGLLAIPGAAYGWVALIGLSLGVLLPMTLTLPLDVADRPSEVASVSAAMIGGGYVIAALSPLMLGMIRDATGSFTPGLVLLLLSSALLSVSALALTPTRLQARDKKARQTPAHRIAVLETE